MDREEAIKKFRHDFNESEIMLHRLIKSQYCEWFPYAQKMAFLQAQKKWFKDNNDNKEKFYIDSDLKCFHMPILLFRKYLLDSIQRLGVKHYYQKIYLDYLLSDE